MSNLEIEQLKRQPIKLVWIVLAVMALCIIYIFHEKSFLSFIVPTVTNAKLEFIFNKTVRVVLNDLFMLWIIHLWFNNKSITSIAILIQTIDILVLLPAYFFLKLTLEGVSEISSPLLSQFHRLIVNPTLMILIFPAIYFQRLHNTNK